MGGLPYSYTYPICKGYPIRIQNLLLPVRRLPNTISKLTKLTSREDLSSIQDIGLSLHLANMICAGAGTGKPGEKDRGSSSETRVLVSNPAPPPTS